MSQVDIPSLPFNGSPPGTSLFEISNSGVSESTSLDDIIFGLQETSEKNQANGYAGLDASTLLDPAQIPDLSATYQVVSTKDLANGYAGLDGTAVLKLSAYPSGNALEFLRRNAANTALEFATTGSVSPLTTKGDIFGYDTGNARIPVGTDGQVLTANSVQALGVEWTTPVISDTPWIEDHDAAGFRLINVSQYETNATNPAASGAIRLGDTESIAWRNQANTADFSILSDDIELQFNGWEDISFIEAEDVSFPNAVVVVSTLQLNGTGELDVGGSQIFDVAEIQSANSSRNDLVLNLGNTEIISWEKATPVNGAISIITNASDNFVIQRSASQAGAFVEEYIFSTTGADFLSHNLTMGTAYIDIGEITIPANPAANVGRLYTKDVAAITKLFFLDSAGTETDVLASSSPLTTKGDLFTYDTGNQRLPVGADNQVLVANSAEATGLEWQTPAAAVQTPWAQDIDADGFDLQDLSNLEFRDTTGAPAGTVPNIHHTAAGMFLNVAATTVISLLVNAALEFTFDDTELDMNGNTLNLNAGILRFNNANTTIEQSTNDLFIDVATGGAHNLRVNDVAEYVFNSTVADFQGNNLTNLALTTSVTVSNSLNWADGVKQTFNPDNTNAGLNVGANAAEPSVPVNGDLFYDSTALAMKARINGAWVELGSGGGSANQIIQLNTSITVTDTGADGLADTVIDGVSKIQSDITKTIMNATRFEQAAATSDVTISSNNAILNAEGNYFEFNNTVATLDSITTTDWQAGSIISVRARDANATGVTFRHQETPAGSAASLFLIGGTNFTITNATDEQIITFMYDGTNWVELNRSVSASQTPWASDIFAAGFDLQDLSNLEFQNTTGAPAGTKPNIHHDPGGMNINVAAATAISLLVGGTDEYSFSSFVADFKANDIIGVTDLTLAGNINFPDGIRQTFNPNATNSGLNVGLQSSPDPTSPVNGDMYYNSTTDKFRAYEGGVWKDVLGGSQSPWLSDIDAAGFNLTNVGYVESNAASPAQAGTLRLGNTEALAWRNFGDTGQLVLLADTDDNLTTQMAINGLAGDLVFKRINFEFLRGTGTGISVTGQADITTFVNLTEIATPANPAANDGRLYVKDVSTVTHLFFLDSAGTETDLLAGGSLTPWTSDIEAATFDLNNLGNLNFSLTGATGLPAITEPYITWDDTLTPDAMRFNVPSATEYSFYFNGVEEYHWSATEFNLHNNILDDVGNIFQNNLSATALTQLGRSDEVTGQDVSDIRFVAGNTRYAEIFVNMVSAVSGSEIGEIEFLIKNDNTTTMDSLLRLVGGATATSARIFFGAPMGTTLDMAGFVVNNISSLRSNAGASLISTVGFVRMGNAEQIGWRNAGDTADHKISFNASDQFLIEVTSGSDYLFGETEMSMGANAVTNVGMFSFITRNELTIATGAVTITRSWHSIDTEGNAATDDLDTINGGVNGRVIVIGANSPVRTVVVKDGTGNIQCAGDFSMDHSNDMMTLIYDGTNWLEISRSDNSP